MVAIEGTYVRVIYTEAGTRPGLRLPGSGGYVFTDGLSLLTVDVAQDLGTYVEPNVWIEHQQRLDPI